ncbi:SDR family oxidoreductase [Seonamhaeicola algicola]|uniref:SDR family oxidoreductase n=1 Tax=Seonamhaeicola algicola TaxID=1719036 RepID=A0A5C7AS07_9FLAO|nr:SDR family oxidoreductase [Seonamhaeicola algicola]TXE11546.1 SDR family oxidoreductase [Seonamhaeicola algicola]
MENILVAGANGTTGKQIVNLLNASQYFKPIAMVRKAEQKKQFEAENIETVLADLEEDLNHVFDNNKTIDKVLFAAGSGGKNVFKVDQDGAKRLIDASKANNIKKFVMLSSMGADKPEEANKLHDYLKAKHNADEYLKSSGLNYSIVRPGTLTNNAAEHKIKLEESLNEHGEISRADVAQTLVKVLNDDTANKATFEIIKGHTLIGEALNKFSTVVY